MKDTINLFFLFLCIPFINACNEKETIRPAIIVDHNCTNLGSIPVDWINSAKAILHIAYGHTSHGSQLITGMDGLAEWKGLPYLWNNGTLDNHLDIRDGIMAGDLGQMGDLNWEGSTRSFLNDWRNDDINVLIWSWGDGVSDNTEEGIKIYLDAMNQLEIDFPHVMFVYMTGHLDGTGETGNLHLRNQQIRKFCRDNNKILYDFADIESWDPDGNYYLDKAANDNCDYDGDGDKIRESNWAIHWQETHTENIDWFNCSPAYTQALNANLKAYAAWWLWARLAGWDGV
jgi:hypothetical protein